MTVLDRVIADSRDRPAWEAARVGRIGASNAASFAFTEAEKPGSIDRYTGQMLGAGFTGNDHTEVGNNWEATALAAVGWEQSTLMFASAANPYFSATPDGIQVMPDGRIRLAETKSTRNVKIAHDGLVAVPKTHERQMAWAAYVCDAYETDYIVNPIGADGVPRELQPFVRTLPRNEELIEHLLEIATPVLARYRAALEFERTNQAW